MNATPAPSDFIVEVEQEVLGALLIGADFRKVSAILRDDHFVQAGHGLIYKSIRTAFERFDSVSMPVVAKLVSDDDRQAFETATGSPLNAYLAQLAAGCVAGPAYVQRSAKRVVEQWARLKIRQEAELLVAAAADPAGDPMKLVTGATQSLDAVASEIRRGPKRKTRLSLSEAAGNAFSAAEEARQRGNGLTGITWGLTDINRVTGGIQRRDLTLIAARPSMGKTTVALSCAIKAARTGIGVGYISLEMDADKLAARAVTDIAYDWAVKAPYADLIRGSIEGKDIEALKSAARDLDKLPLYFEDQSGLSMTDIRVKIELMMEDASQAGTPIQCVVVDHMGLIRPSQRYAGNRVHEITEITGGAKELAREYGIAIILLSQLNRALEARDNKRPQLSDLRDSGSIEQDADTVAFLYRDAYYLERDKGGGAEKQAERAEKLIDCQNKLEFIIAKQRNGPLTTIDLFADMACGAIRSGVRT